MNEEIEQSPLKKNGYTNVKKFRMFDYSDTSINELYLNNKFAEQGNSHLAFSNTYANSKSFVRNDLYANSSDYRDSTIYGNSLSNEGVKILLEKEYLKDPRKATQEAITSIFNEVSKEYTISDEDKKLFSGFGDNPTESREARNNAIFQLQKKQEFADKKLLKALESCNDLLNLLSQVETGEKKSFNVIAKNKLDYAVNEVFKKEFIDSSFLPETARQDVYSKIENFSFIEDADSQDDEYRKKFDNLLYGVNEILTPYYKNDNRLFDDLEKKQIAKSLTGKLKDISTLNSNINKYTSLAVDLNTKVKMNKDFVGLYSIFTKYGALSKDTSLDETIKKHKTKKVIEELVQYVSSNQDTVKNISKNNYVKENLDIVNLINNNLLNKSPDELYETLEEDKVSKFISYYLTQTLHDNINDVVDLNDNDFNENEKRKIKDIVSKNIQDMSKEYVSALAKKDGKFNSRSASGIYNAFQKRTFQNLIENIVFDTKNTINPNDKELKENILSDFDIAKTTDLGINTKNYDSERVVEIMNFNNLNNNKQINKDISAIEMEKIARQTFKDANLREFSKSIRNTQIHNESNNMAKKDLSISDNIRNIATVKYDNIANAILENSFNKMFFSRKTFKEFQTCASSSSVQKTNVDTKLGTLDKCITKLTTDLEQDAKHLAQIATSASQGIGAINPFAMILELVAKIRERQIRGIKESIEMATMEVNKIALEVGSAHTDLERRARINIMHARDDAEVKFSAIHDTEKNALASELIQEYISEAVIKNEILIDSFRNKSELEIDSMINGHLDSLNIANISLEDKLAIEKEKFQEVLQNTDEISPELKETSNYYEFLAKNPSVDDMKKLNLSLEDALDLSKFNFKESENKELVEAQKQVASLLKGIERIDTFQKKITELKLANNGELKNSEEYVLFKNETAEQKILSDWALKNEITQEVFDHYINKDFNELENDKLTMSFQLIRKSLDEQKIGLIEREDRLIELKKEAYELEKEYGSFDEMPTFKNDEEESLFNRFMEVKKEIGDIESFLSSQISPRERIENAISELENIIKFDSSDLEKRNIISSAINILSSDDSTFLNIEALEKYSSLAVDFAKENLNDDKSILGLALDEKAYLLKVNKEARDSPLRYASQKFREYFEDIDYQSDLGLMKDTRESKNVSSLQSWSDTLSGMQDNILNNKTVGEANKEIQNRAESLIATTPNKELNTGYQENKIKNYMHSEHGEKNKLTEKEKKEQEALEYLAEIERQESLMGLSR